MNGDAAGSRERQDGKGPAPDADTLKPTPDPAAPKEDAAPASNAAAGAGGKKLPPAAIAGIVVGSIAGVALLALAAFLGERSTRNWRQGWSKETLDGAGGVVVGGGSGRTTNRRTVGAGWGTRVAARETDNAVFGVMPPVREAP